MTTPMPPSSRTPPPSAISAAPLLLDVVVPTACRLEAPAGDVSAVPSPIAAPRTVIVDSARRVGPPREYLVAPIDAPSRTSSLPNGKNDTSCVEFVPDGRAISPPVRHRRQRS